MSPPKFNIGAELAVGPVSETMSSWPAGAALKPGKAMLAGILGGVLKFTGPTT